MLIELKSILHNCEESELAIDSDLMAKESRLNESEFLWVSESACESST